METLPGISRQILDCVHKALHSWHADERKVEKDIT